MKDHVAAHWAGAILICGKCSKKLGGGFGAKRRRALATLLREEDGFGKGRKATLGVVETRCLDICPKGAVVLVDTREPGRWRLVEEGYDVAALATDLRGR